MIQGVLFGQEMAKLAADKAGEQWKKQALDAFIDYAKNHSEFMTEDVRVSYELGEPPDNRAWGHIAVAAKRQGIVATHGYGYSSQGKGHPTPATIWKSKVYNG